MGKTNNKRNNIFSDFMNLGFGVVANIALGFLTTPIITRVVDTAEYGKLAIFNTYSGLILSIVFFGLDNAIIRFFYDSDEIQDKKRLLKLCILIPAISSIAVVLGMFALMKTGLLVLKLDDIVIMFLCVEVVFSIWNKYSTTLLRLTYKTKAYSACSIIQKAVYCGLIIALSMANKKDVVMLVIATIVSLAITSVVATILTKEYWDFGNISFPDNTKEIISYSLPFIVFSFVITLADSADKLFVDHFCSEAEVGIYTSAFTLLVIFDIVKTTFNILWKPIQTEHFVKHPDDPSFLQTGAIFVTIIMFFVGINAIMFKDVLAYFLGESYRNAVYYMPFLVIDSIMCIISETTCSGIEKSKKSYLYILVSLLPCVANVACCFMLVPIIGARGAAIARALTNTVYFSVRTYFSNKYYYIDYKIKNIVCLLIATVLFAAVNTFMEFGAVTIITYIICIAAIAMLYNSDIKDLMKVILDTLKPYISLLKKS